MADGNKAGSSHDGAFSGGTNPPDLGNADRPGIMESNIGETPPRQAYGCIVGVGAPHTYANLHPNGGGGGGYFLGGYADGYTNLHGSGYPHGLGNYYGSGHLHGFVNGYANSLWSGGGGGTAPFNPHYGDLQLSGGGSGAICRRAPGNLSNNNPYYNNSSGGASAWPQQAPMNMNNAAVPLPPRFLSTGNGAISRPPQRPDSEDHALITGRMADLTIGHRNRSYFEEVKGNLVGVARSFHGCQFLRRMLKERREDAVRDMFDEVAVDIVKLMGHAVAAVFVDDMSRLWTDEQVTSVVQTLGKSFPSEVMAAARNQSGSNVLQILISRIVGRRQEIECFVRGLAGVGEINLLALIKDHAGSRVIQKCLETFSPQHNLFIVMVVMRNPYDVACNKHGCHAMRLCVDNSMEDAQTRDYLVYAVCKEGLLLAQNQFRNYVVQHVIGAVQGVPWAMEMLHAAFRNKYGSLSRQKASSNVVQACLAFFPEALRYQIVWELLSDHDFPELIRDPFANYVLQSAVSTTKGPMLRLLEDAIRPYRDTFRDNMHARKLLKMVFPYRRQHQIFRIGG